MTNFRLSWSRSLAAVAVAAVLGPFSRDGAAHEMGMSEQTQPASQGLVVAMLAGAEDQEGERPREVPREQRERNEREMRRERELQELAEAERQKAAAARHREELQEVAQNLKRELAELKREGRHEVARDVAEKMERVLDELRAVEARIKPPRGPEAEERAHAERDLAALMRERRELQEAIRNHERELQELKREGRHEVARDVAEKMERLLAGLRDVETRIKQSRGRVAPPEKPRPDDVPREEIERRMHHLRAAAENLHAAGLHDQAEKLLRGAEQLARGAIAPPKEPGPPHAVYPARPHEHDPDPVHHLQRQLDEMRGQMQELQHLLRELMQRERR